MKFKFYANFRKNQSRLETNGRFFGSARLTGVKLRFSGRLEGCKDDPGRPFTPIKRTYLSKKSSPACHAVERLMGRRSRVSLPRFALNGRVSRTPLYVHVRAIGRFFEFRK